MKIIKNQSNKYYNYIYLDPRKPGKYTYDNFSVWYEPIYVGKGKNNRYLAHIKQDHRNTLKLNVITKILKAGYDLKKYIIILYDELSEEKSFINEKKLILNIGRRITNTGPLCNMDEGGRGSDTMSHHPRKKEIMRKSKRIGDKHFAYKKTYDELYGDRADEERIKRSMPLQGIQHSKERKENSRNGHLGQIPWNKGLTKETDVRVLKYAQNKISKNFIKKYKIEDIKTGEIFNFKGKKKLNCFIRKINKQYKWGCKINVDTLISQLKHRNFKIIIEE